jgi:hypothetical protein
MRCPLRAASRAGHGARVTGWLVEIGSPHHLLGTSGPERLWVEIAAVEDSGQTAAVVRVDGIRAALLGIAGRTRPAAPATGVVSCSSFARITRALNDAGIPSPSAADPRRNTHRAGQAWMLTTVRASLANPRYTGRQVWNRQPSSMDLIDPANTGLGRRQVQRWGMPEGGLCAAAHKPPNEQCWVMRSAGLPGLVGAGSASERCA